MPTIVFKEWLPDLPALGNPGLIRAENVLPGEGGYIPYKPLAPVQVGSYTLPGIPRGGYVAELQYPASPPYAYYAATNVTLYMAETGGTFGARSSGLSTMSPSNEVRFAQYEDYVFAARGNGGLQFHTAGSATNFATVSGMTGTRDPRYVFVVGQFLVVANLGSATASASAVEWSSIDQPTVFPTPGSATAIASQSGRQVLNLDDGPVVGGFGGDQYGIILQTGAVTRMTYVGPPAVFQFDKLDQKKGSDRRYGSAASGNIVHTFSADGFYKTDGVSVIPIGEGKVNKTFLSQLDADATPGAVTATAIVDSAYDHTNGNIVWAYPSSATTRSNKLLVYSTEYNSFTSCNQTCRSLIEPSPSIRSHGLYAFNDSNVLCRFSATAGTAVIETGDFELNEGGRAYVDAIKPHVESSGTAPSVTVAIGYRDSLSANPSYTSETTPNSRTGFANVRVDAKYARARETITGNFEKATGLEFNATPSGSA